MNAPFDSQAVSLSAALIAGMIGSAHCFAMCGGLSGALGMRVRAGGASAAHSLVHALATQFGRIGSYSIAGALCGGIGAALQTLLDLAGVAQGLRVIAGVLLIAIAIRIAFAWNC